MRRLGRCALLSLLWMGLAGAANAASVQLVVISADNALTAVGGNDITLGASGGSVIVEVFYDVGTEGLIDITFDLTSGAVATGFSQPSLIMNNGAIARVGSAALSGGDILGYSYGGPGISSATAVSLGTGTFAVGSTTNIDLRIVEIFGFGAVDPMPTVTGSTITVVPEPSTGLLLAIGLAALARWRA